MSMTDPIADLLTRIRNAHTARHAELSLPASNMKVSIVEILKQEGFVEDFAKESDSRQGQLKIRLKYRHDGRPAISGITRISRPGRRVYRGKHEIPKVLDGLGITILSTPKGVMTGGACHRAGIGGEVLCSIW